MPETRHTFGIFKTQPAKRCGNGDDNCYIGIRQKSYQMTLRVSILLRFVGFLVYQP